MAITDLRFMINHLNQPELLSTMREWQPFREGVDISVIYQEPDSGPSAAFLRYAPGASVPEHEHMGYEHILILDGSQSDENGVYDAGTLLVQAKGTRHQVSSDQGCLVLAVWNRSVEFL